MADRRRNRPATDAAATDDGSDLVVDAETAKALALFNQRLAAQQEAERAQRRIERATKAKDDAAARVRALENDPKATREQRNEAAAAYRAALEAWELAKKGDPEPTGKQEPSSEPEAAGEPEPDGEARGSAV